ncbi:ER membrane protein complex subunit 1-like [Paramacrobiotus metropolitanus]|uniref:ER membrane protein complex subunit 1-like n=1 Tax=Paramacrobiotus metropolitanus TaxID=2943436 RepID=UPI002445B376|nr:ER membrane protein complex subunit 1-like [Paramacrobiotus metropolitanus]
MHPLVKQCTLLIYCIILCSVLQVIQALHEDQVGLYDWSLQFVGRPVEVLLSSKSSSATSPKTLAFVYTEQNVLAAVDLKFGEIAWRQVFERSENPSIASAFLTDEEICVIIGQGNILRCFDQVSGGFKWERALGGKGTDNVACASLGRATGDGSTSSRIICAAGEKVLSFNSKLGNQLWESKDVKSQKKFISFRASEVLVASLDENKISVRRYSPQNGELKENSFEKAAIVNPATTKCVLAQPDTQAAYFLVCVDGISQRAFTFSTSGPDRSQQLSTFEEMGTYAQGEELSIRHHTGEYFSVLSGKESFLFQLQIDGKLLLSAKLPNSKVDMCASKEFVSLQRTEGNVELRSASAGSNAEKFSLVSSVPFPRSFGNIKQVRVIPGKEDCSKSSVIFWTSGDVFGLISQGKLLWKREEGLAYLQSTAIVDLPVSDIEALVEEEFEEKGTFLLRFAKRLVAQALQLKKLVELGVNSLVKGLRTGQFFEKEHLERDYFNTHKIIVGVNDRGKVYGLDSHNGDVVYSMIIEDFVKPVNHKVAFYLQRAGAHAPFASQAVIIGADKKSGNGLMYFFDCITGEELQKPLQLNRPVLQTGLIPVMTSNHLEAVFVLDTDYNVNIYPSLNIPELKDFVTKSLTIFDADMKSGIVRGFRVIQSDQGFKAREMWTNTLTAEGESVVSVTPKRPHDNVYSQGKVLADRRVLYKYINPNLVSVAVQGTDEAKKPYVKIVALDGITGRVAASLVQRRARSPVNVVHSENWIMYSYWNEKSRSSELGVVELYRGFDKPNKTYFSSLESFGKPEAIASAFRLPGFVNDMQETVTAGGITHKNLILGLASGSLLQIPKVLLDPRRPLFPSAAEREEGLVPYAPELPYMTEHVINYYKKVHNIRGIQTGIAGLESISLVFAFGLDLYFTRVMPSALFDVLSDSFDYWILSVVMLVMTIASVIVRNLANAKALRLAWK